MHEARRQCADGRKRRATGPPQDPLKVSHRWKGDGGKGEVGQGDDSTRVLSGWGDHPQGIPRAHASRWDAPVERERYGDPRHLPPPLLWPPPRRFPSCVAKTPRARPQGCGARAAGPRASFIDTGPTCIRRGRLPPGPASRRLLRGRPLAPPDRCLRPWLAA
ncbi:unnamed protein product [Amoebophrya sp. A120]|nr:unnamed protein product [Amoebophrya sp. A120]|eukprot:GSA120T00019889001.1